MDKPPRLRHLHEQSQDQTAEQAAGHQSAASAPGLDFETPEALLRHDAAETPAPPALAERLRNSLSDEPAPRAPWWRRLLGGDRS
jgi:hypothetical protein